MIPAANQMCISAIGVVEPAERATILQVVATRSPHGVRYAVEAGRRAGISIAALLAGTGLTEETLPASGYAIDQDAEFALTTNLIRELGDPVSTGIAVGSRFTVGDLGIWGYALISSANAAEALAVAVAYVSLAPTFFKPQAVQRGDIATVLLRDEHLPIDVRDFYAARDLSGLPLLLRTAGLSGAPVTVQTRFDGPEGQQVQETLSPINVETGAPAHAIRVPAAGLAVPLRTADPVTRAACARECERLVHAQTARSALSATIRSRFVKTPGAMPGIDDLAAELHMSTRTLRRQLDHEGTSYRALRTEVAQTLAVELLSVVGLSVTEVARRLGYSDTTSFSHAFRRWTGRPASVYRPL
jgi:AraC-like DNA-binding protein